MRLAKFSGEFIPQTGCSVPKRAISDLQRGRAIVTVDEVLFCTVGQVLSVFQAYVLTYMKINKLLLAAACLMRLIDLGGFYLETERSLSFSNVATCKLAESHSSAYMVQPYHQGSNCRPMFQTAAIFLARTLQIMLISICLLLLSAVLQIILCSL